MKKKNKFFLLSAGIIVFCVVLDQILKIWVKTHMALGEHFSVIGKWFLFLFVENEGMAFGMQFGDLTGKLILSIARVIIVGLIIAYLVVKIRQNKVNVFFVSVFSLIIAGALGNIIDSLFYGIIFDYAPFMFGKVVDMFYFPLFPIPEKFPLWGGSYFFPAIFNIADSCVTVGIFLLLIFNKRIFKFNEQSQA